MGSFFQKLERKFGRYAIQKLTYVLIACYVVGYIFETMFPQAALYMNLNIYQVLHGQIWRLVTWVIIPPSSLSIFTIIMLFFYLSIGTSLERAWGDFYYNLYIFGGFLVSIIAAFLIYIVFGLTTGAWAQVGLRIGSAFSTYYVTMSLMLAFAATFPNTPVYLMFVLRIPMKYLGYLYGAYIVYDIVQDIRYASQGYIGYWIDVVAICASMLNFAIFFLTTRKGGHLTKQQRATRRNFRRAQSPGAFSRKRESSNASGSGAERVVPLRPYRHRCEICGRTDVSDPELEFRYCSKCAGAHEYCMEHLYTHVHVTEDAQSQQGR